MAAEARGFAFNVNHNWRLKCLRSGHCQDLYRTRSSKPIPGNSMYFLWEIPSKYSSATVVLVVDQQWYRIILVHKIPVAKLENGKYVTSRHRHNNWWNLGSSQKVKKRAVFENQIKTFQLQYNENPEDFNSEVEAFAKLRNTSCVYINSSNTELALDNMEMYYCQLAFFKNRFQILESPLMKKGPFDFPWTDVV